ncbi:hypothetical protein RIF23_16900 [Lipingzhangella sp. LS1_29]|uniref:Uncharacterized protein n=1 Tax=Lipingzhangella rawalii TaxID=2055835 RepID=A0ABU2H9J5_9ACTN|nr:hypothetical protein [Lipingzhangella rawalii]MDS1271972.1 hypothetical protein [Lipingzhangella rawalii]
MEPTKRTDSDGDIALDDLVREELGDEPSQEAIDYARELYERYRLPTEEEKEDS